MSLLVNSVNNRLKADVYLKTLTLANGDPAGEEIAFPGEYEIKDIEIQGWPLAKESTEKFVKTIYLVTWEEMKFLFLGHISKPLDAELLEEIGEPDLVFLPTGDDHFIDPEAGAKLIKQLEPAFIVPAFYKNANAFLKTMGQKTEPQEKLVFRKKDLPAGKAQVVLLEVPHP